MKKALPYIIIIILVVVIVCLYTQNSQLIKVITEKDKTALNEKLLKSEVVRDQKELIDKRTLIGFDYGQRS